MPKAKKRSANKTSSKLRSRKEPVMHEMIDAKTENLLGSSEDHFHTHADPMAQNVRWGVIAIVVLAALVIYLGGKGYIVAAMVNGKPIFRWDINREMNKRFGQQTLETAISESLIVDAAKKKEIIVSQAEVSAKSNEVVKSLGPNVKLDDLLKYQGMTKDDFEHQIRLQLTVEKILGKDVAVTDKDVNDFITKNKDSLTATDEAAMRGEARDALKSQKINEKMQPWFAELKKNAKVVRLMK